MHIDLTINGKEHSIDVEPQELLLDTLRTLGYKGAKKGCGEGTCGACTILLDGQPVYSCIMFSAQAHNREITTIEGMGTPTQVHPIQKTFIKHGAVQCGFCTPGMVLATSALLEKNKTPSEDEIKQALDGNLCRCTGYIKIIDAVKVSAKNMR